MHRIVKLKRLTGPAAVLVAVIAITGCSGSTATFPPPAGATTAAATGAPAGTSTSAPSTTAVATEAATSTAAPTDTAPPTDTPAPTATATPPGTPGPTPTSRAAACSGNDTNKAFIAEAAAKLSFAVYCAVLPTSWWIQSGSYKLPNGGLLQLAYRNSAGATINLSEGNICPTICAAIGSFVGNYLFGDLPATLYTTAGSYMLYVGPIGDPSYLMTSGQGAVSQSNFVAWAAALRKVPKS